MTFLPKEIYSKAHECLPIVCVDIVVVSDNKSILLIKRKQEPAKGQWWFPGGRLLKYEKPTEAVSRIMKSETNLELAESASLGISETRFNADPFNHGSGTHTINFLYAAKPKMISLFNLILDDNHSEFNWVGPDEIYSGQYDNYIKRFTAISEGVF